MSAATSNKPLSRPTSSTHAGFLSLPIDLCHNIYRQVLAVPHPLFLFQDPDEAKMVLYSENEFALEEGTKRQGSLLKSFLDCIGSVKTGSLSYLRMNLPATERVYGQLDDIKIGEDGWQTLPLLQERCTSLKTPETLIYSTNCVLDTDKDINVRFLQDALQDIDKQFRAIGSLDRIIVKISSGSPAPKTVELMQQLGWIVLPRNW
ncbi:hypothetical protein BDV33DRAFT_194779 [Aspergillus novoparasiticus]|uniref:Uncharacterized protein n=1 Tax=Aspergillus novoparasiticus TaxID=986946 RepID=A0A5N6EFX9_9EURO|nr:hypothetical protein BDV33DRAFT_194779 [Aspergillus novoparasiticus]